MAFYIKKPSGWTPASSFHVKKSNGWKTVTKAFIKKATGWVQFWPQSGPSPEYDLYLSVYPVTYPSNSTVIPELTLYNQHWSYDGTLTLQYKWQVSSSVDGPWTDITSFSTYTPGNPSSGNTNSLTFTPSLSDYVSGRVYFKFIMKATDSITTSEYSSISDPVTVGGPTWINDPAWNGTGAVGTTLTWSAGRALFNVDSTNVGYMTTIYKSNDGGTTKTYIIGTGIDPAFSITDLQTYSINITSGDAGYTYYASTYSIFSDGSGPKSGAYSSTTISDSKIVVSNYSFSIGSNLYVSTNGYVGLNSGSTGYASVPSTGSNIIVHLSDFVQYQTVGGSGAGLLLYWSDSTQYSLRWSGYLYGHENSANYRVTYQINFYPSQAYYDIKYVYVGANVYSTSLSSVVPGLYTDGSKIANGTTLPYPWLISTGTTYRVYYDGSSTTSGVSFTEINASDMVSAGTVTNGNTDDGYTEITTAFNQYTYPTISIGTITTTSSSLSIPLTGTFSSYDYTIRTGSYSGTIVASGNYATASTLSVTGLSSLTTYYITVSPMNSLGQYGTSAQTTAATSAPLPTIPTSLTATTNRTDGVNLTFSGSTNATSYDIFWNIAASSYPSPAATPDFPGVTSPYLDTGISAGATRYYWVRGKNANGVSDWYPFQTNGVTGTRQYYVVTYDGNGGSTPSAANVSPGSSTTLPSSSRSGYTFNGWYTAASGGSFIGNAGSSYTPSSSITLYAQWSVITYTVTYNANGGSVSPSSNTVNAGSSVTFPTPSRSGYTFAGWYTVSSGGTFLGIGGSTYTPTASITIYAQWNVILYTVTYNGNGGSTPGSVSINAGSSTTLPNSTRANYTLNGWYTAPTGGTYVGTNGNSYTPPSSITLYAQWTAVPVPNISQIVARNGGTGGAYKMQWTITATNTASYFITVQYGTTTSLGNSFNNTVSSSPIQTNLGSTINDYYVLNITPYSGAGATGTAGTTRVTTIKRNTATPTNSTNTY